MAFPDGWMHKVSLTIDSAYIDSDLTDWTLVFDQSFNNVLTQDNGPLDADGSRPSINGGGDIRFSSDSDGSNRLACDIRDWVTNDTPGNATCEVAVKVTSVSSGPSDTVIYMWWGKSGETQPSASDTYGQYNTYDDDHICVVPMREDPSTTTQKDRTSNQLHWTSNGSMTSGDIIDGQVGKAIDMDGIDDYLSRASENLFDSANGTVELLAEFENGHDSSDPERPLFRRFADNNNNMILRMYGTTSLYGKGSDGEVEAKIERNGTSRYTADSKSSWAADTWFYFAYRVDGSNLKLRYDDDTDNSISNSNSLSFTSITQVGYHPADAYHEGAIDELRVSSANRSDAWVLANYYNQFNTSGFLTWGSIEDTAVPRNWGTIIF
jgi:hypothetical protein